MRQGVELVVEHGPPDDVQGQAERRSSPSRRECQLPQTLPAGACPAWSTPPNMLIMLFMYRLRQAMQVSSLQTPHALACQHESRAEDEILCLVRAASSRIPRSVVYRLGKHRHGACMLCTPATRAEHCSSGDIVQRHTSCFCRACRGSSRTKCSQPESLALGTGPTQAIRMLCRHSRLNRHSQCRGPQ